MLGKRAWTRSAACVSQAGGPGPVPAACPVSAARAWMARAALATGGPMFRLPSTRHGLSGPGRHRIQQGTKGPDVSVY